MLVLTSIGKKDIIRKNAFYLENKLPTPTLASILKKECIKHLYSTDRIGVEKDLISLFVKYNIHFTQLTKKTKERTSRRFKTVLFSLFVFHLYSLPQGKGLYFDFVEVVFSLRKVILLGFASQLYYIRLSN